MRYDIQKKHVIAAAVILAIITGAYAMGRGDTAAEKKKRLIKNPYKIMIATDLHYLSPELSDNGKFFMETIENGDGKTTMYSSELADSMIDAVIEESPDIFIISGDMSFNGEKRSHEELSEKLASLKKKGIGVIVIPGNHDIDNSQAVKFSGGSFEAVESVSDSEFYDIYYDMGMGTSVAKDTDSFSYIYESVKGIQILMLDVNANSAPGSVSDETLAWLEVQLKKAKQKGVPVIAVSHQNLLVHNESFAEGYVIGNADKLLQLYEEYDVLCNLSGHMHLQHVKTDEKVPEIVTGAISSSPHYYGIVTYSGQSLSYEAKTLDVGAVDNFASWSESFFNDISKNKTIRELDDSAGSDAEMENAADIFARLNYLYFSGRSDLISEMKGLDVLDKYVKDDTFLDIYIKSILNDDPYDSTKADISF